MKSFNAQFREPSGYLGWLAGVLMSLKNAGRSRWVLGLLDPRAGEHILEVGFGSGADIARLLDTVAPGGTVSGVDASDAMVRMAARRNRRAVSDGRARLAHGNVPELPFPAGGFDAVYSVNCAQFWPNLEVGLTAIGRVLRVGGRAAIAVQPRNPGASSADSTRWLEVLASAAAAAGFAIDARELGPDPVPTAAVLLRKLAA